MKKVIDTDQASKDFEIISKIKGVTPKQAKAFIVYVDSIKAYNNLSCYYWKRLDKIPTIGKRTAAKIHNYLMRIKKIKYGSISYEGVNYKTREINIDGQYFNVAQASLNYRIMDGGNYRDAEARSIDESIIFYANEQEMILSINELKQLIQ